MAAQLVLVEGYTLTQVAEATGMGKQQVWEIVTLIKTPRRET